MYTLNGNGIFTQWSKEAEALTGFTLEEVVGRRFLDFVSYRFRRDVEELLRTIATEKSIPPLQLPFFSKFGEPVEVVLLATPKHDEHGDFSVQCVLSEVNLGIGSQSDHDSNLIVMTVDDSWRIIDWNEEAEESTLFLRSEVLGWNFLALITDEYVNVITEMLRQAAESMVARPIQIPLYAKSGERLDVILNARADSGSIVIRGRGVGTPLYPTGPQGANASLGNRISNGWTNLTVSTMPTLSELGPAYIFSVQSTELDTDIDFADVL
eukprot:TRINITY_DN23801_c0_g1_i1.p1 TRINITY_DN23801_c0_g1~~TRINITY_DN23801_c0_g1_i1.p1  ORF type:complete len:268 (-),score=48.51 TRINITY_DN23801_c0_g1_i1:177-980(-)